MISEVIDQIINQSIIKIIDYLIYLLIQLLLFVVVAAAGAFFRVNIIQAYDKSYFDCLGCLLQWPQAPFFQANIINNNEHQCIITRNVRCNENLDASIESLYCWIFVDRQPFL